MCCFNLVCCSSQSTLHDLSIVCYGDWEQEPTFMSSHILTTFIINFMHLCCLAGGHLPFLQFGNIQRSSLPQIVDGYSSAVTSIAGGFPFGTSRQSTIYVSKSNYSIYGCLIIWLLIVATFILLQISRLYVYYFVSSAGFY